MALLTSLDRAVLEDLLSAYALELEGFEPLEAGSVNSNFRLRASGRAYFARVYEEQGVAGAETELTLLEALARRGIPVALPLRRSDGGLLCAVDGKPFAVYPYVEGEILCQRRVTPAACRAVGQALAQVHSAPAPAGLGAGRFRFEDLTGRLATAEATGRADLVAAAARLRQLMDHYGPLRDAALPQGVIHGDLFRDNVLFRGEEVAALLDFESASRGTFAYDVMVTLLAWCYGDRLEPSLAAALLEGYHAVRPLTQAERAALVTEGAVACIRFATTRITDFSMRTPTRQQPKRQFQRFLARLEALEAGALTPLVAHLTG